MPDNPHILVVDDDARLRELLRKFLSDRGFRITTAANSAEAEARLGSIAFDLIVLDVMMPGETRVELTRRLRRTHSVPILLLTAHNESPDRTTPLPTAADDYLSNPSDPH